MSKIPEQTRRRATSEKRTNNFGEFIGFQKPKNTITVDVLYFRNN